MSLNLKTKHSLLPKMNIQNDTSNLTSDAYYQNVYPNEAAPFGGELQNVATFQLQSNNSMIDLFETYLEGSMSMNLGTTGFMLDGSAHSLFTRVRLLQQNGNSWEDILNYNEKVAAEIVITSGSNRCATKWASYQDNVNIDLANKVLINATQKQFRIYPKLSFALHQKIAHLPVCGNLLLEFTFDHSDNVNVYSVAGVTIRVDNLLLRAKYYPMSQEYIQELKKLAYKGELIYNFENVYVQNTPWSNASNSVSILYPVGSATSALVRFYLPGDLNTIAKSSIQKSNFLTGLTSLQFQHGNDFIPRQELRNAEDCLIHLQDVYQLTEDVNSSSIITRANYQCADANSTIAAIPLFYVAVNFKNGDEINTGIDLNNAPLIFKTTNTVISTLYARIFMYYSTVVQVVVDGRSIVSV